MIERSWTLLIVSVMRTSCDLISGLIDWGLVYFQRQSRGAVELCFFFLFPGRECYATEIAYMYSLKRSCAPV